MGAKWPEDAAETEAGAATEAMDIEENTKEAAEAWREAPDTRVPKNTLVDVVDLLTLLAKVPEEDLTRVMGAALLKKVKTTSKKATTIFDDAKFPQRYELNELWWATAQGSPEAKANLILETLLKEAPKHTIISISLPICMRAHVPNQATKLAQILSQSPELTNLDLSESRIAWQEIESYSKRVPIKLKSLKVLDLKDCDLHDERYSILRFFEMVRSWECNDLISLDLSHNRLRDANIEWQPLLGQLTQLQHLNLSTCGLYQSSIANVTDGLRRCTTLTDLDLSCSRLGNFGSENGIHIFFTGLRSLSQLQKLNLHLTEMNDENLQFLARNITQYPALKKLDISDNDLNDQGIRSLIEVLPECTNLTQLDLHGTRCGDTAQDLVRACIEISSHHGKFFLNLSRCVVTSDNIIAIRHLCRRTQCLVHF